jgi:hypothetical protein
LSRSSAANPWCRCERVLQSIGTPALVGSSRRSRPRRRTDRVDDVASSRGPGAHHAIARLGRSRGWSESDIDGIVPTALPRGLRRCTRMALALP